MGSHGIKDQVAIIGVGCTPFTEHWDKSLDDLIIDAAGATYASAGVSQDDVDAFWFGTSQSAASGLAMAGPLKIHGKPVSRVENYCATGSEAMRQAAYAVASGAYDVVMALGAEKVKDGGYQGLNAFPIPTDGTQRTLTAAAMFSLILPAYSQKYGVDEDQLRYVVAKIAEKNHYNGARNELAQFRRETSAEQICEMAAVAGRLSVFDCAGVADGAAGVIMCRVEDAPKYCDNPLYIKALSFVAGTGAGSLDPDYDYTTLTECKWAADDAYAQAGVTNPRAEIALAEVHDCFTPTELVLMEDLGFAEPGTAWQEVLDGTFALHGDMPINTDGGLKSFGHPVGASGLRMLYEVWLQLRGEAPEERRIPETGRTLGLTHNLGGYPGEMVSFVGIYGSELGLTRLIRPLEIVDVASAAAVYARSLVDSLDFLRPEQCHTAAEHRAHFADVVVARCDVWVAEQEGLVLGVLAMNADEIDRLYVDTERHGRGTGTMLLDHAKGLQPGGLHLVTLQRNERACRFYERHGFVADDYGTSPAPESEPDVGYRWTGSGSGWAVRLI